MKNFSKKYNTFNKNIGFTLVEIGIVLLIAAAIIYAAVRLLGGKNDETKGLEIANVISDSLNKIEKQRLFGAVFVNDNDYINAKVFPPSWISGSSISHSGGGRIGTYQYPTYNQIDIFGLKPKICETVVHTLNNDKNIIAIYVGSFSFPTPGGCNWVKGSGETTGTLNFAQTQSCCNLVNEPSISITFKR